MTIRDSSPPAVTPPARPRAVVFDAVGTLIEPARPVAETYAEVGQRFGSRLGPAEIHRRFGAAFAAEERVDAERGWRTDEPRELSRWRTIVAAVLDDVTDPDGCFRALYDHFGRGEAWRCAEGAGPVLARLAAELPVGMASNFDARLRGIVAELPELRPLSGAVFISSEVGWRKPAAAFFRAVAAGLKLPTAAILFLGDDVRNDYDGAIGAGARALVFDPAGRHWRETGEGGVRSLTELLDRLNLSR